MTAPAPGDRDEGTPPQGGSAPTRREGSGDPSPAQSAPPPSGQISIPPSAQSAPPPSGQISSPPSPGGPKPPPNGKSDSRPKGKSVGLIIGLALAGLVAYSIVNAILGILIFVSTLDQNGTNYPIIISCTIFLALFGLGAGAGLQFLRKPWATGLGLGFLVGWALWSILSAGICTGISPDLYA
ncbi:hypothetical protein ACQP2T_61955 [Nonomuraea sp. CA-143628]|uniref:hypothetical protein n=1 Tax=Nonomuraea sp. CA-143628 TaxID=3239997 RepID=UPI003D9469CB